jgi:hypothetical protein
MDNQHNAFSNSLQEDENISLFSNDSDYDFFKRERHDDDQRKEGGSISDVTMPDKARLRKTRDHSYNSNIFNESDLSTTTSFTTSSNGDGNEDSLLVLQNLVEQDQDAISNPKVIPLLKFGTSSPWSNPSSSPSVNPTTNPSSQPSNKPSSAPSMSNMPSTSPSTLAPTMTKYFTISSRLNGKLCITPASMQVNSNVVLSKCNNKNLKQHWTFEQSTNMVRNRFNELRCLQKKSGKLVISGCNSSIENTKFTTTLVGKNMFLNNMYLNGTNTDEFILVKRDYIYEGVNLFVGNLEGVFELLGEMWKLKKVK